MPSNWEPAWSSEVKIESGGRFPLGLNRFHDALEDMLIKSITVLAERLRYFTFCCWAIGDIEANENCKEYSEFVEAFRRRENALAIGLYLIKPDHTVYGSESLSKWIQTDNQMQDCSFKLMKSVNMGAFDLYYTGTLYNLGLIETTENWVAVPTESGRKLYEIAEQHYAQKNLRYYTKYKGKKEVPTDVLKEWAELNVFSNIKAPECRKERDFFKSIIFYLRSKKADFRRDTFTLFLEAIALCERNNTLFNEDKLRNIHYYSCFKDQSGKIITFNTPEYLKDVQFYWHIYEGHVYFRWWLDSYFQTFIRHLKECVDRGATVDEFFNATKPEEFNNSISFFTGASGDFYNETMGNILKLLSQPGGEGDQFLEDSLKADLDKQTMSNRIARFTLLMAALYNKFTKLRSDKRYQYVIQKQQGNLWFDILYHIRLDKITVKEFLEKMLKTYALKQHDQIMLEKRDLRKSWFTTANNRYYFNADVILLWRPAKFKTIRHFLNDMNLIDYGEEFCNLTAEGKDFYKKLKAEFYS